MDDQRFDKLTRRLSQAVTRRSAWQGGVAGLLGLSGLSAATTEGAAQITSQHCLQNGRVCKPRNPNTRIPNGGNHNHRCKQCCSGFSVPSGKGRKCACRPNGMKSQNSSQCCSGIRREGRCGTPDGPVENCTMVAGVPPNPTGQANGTACTGGSPNACASGYCTATLCQPCPGLCATATGPQCCQDGSFCIDNACRVCP